MSRATDTRWQISDFPAHVPMGLPLPPSTETKPQARIDDERDDNEYSL